jgi:hypothetical protein
VDEPLPVRPAKSVGVGERLGVGGEPLLEGLPEHVNVGEGLGVGEPLAVGLPGPINVGEGLGVGEPLPVGLSERTPLPLGDGVLLDVNVMELVPLGV